MASSAAGSSKSLLTPPAAAAAAVVTVVAALLVVGCAHRGFEDGADDGLDFSARRDRLNAIDSWDLNGRLAIDTGEERRRMRLRWRQRGEDLALTVDSRVPATPSLTVEGNASALTVYPPREQPRVLRDPEAELSAMVGWWLPVTSVEHWLVGLPDPDFPYRDLDRGRSETVAALAQRDWRIRYDNYRLVDGVLVPERITFTHAPLELTLSVSEWRPVDEGADP